MSVASERLVRGVISQPVEMKQNWFVRLQPVFADVAGKHPSKVAVVPEPFEKLNTFSHVYGWTEHALGKLDRFGLSFPSRLVGPVLLPSARNSLNMVHVWLAPDYVSSDENDLVKAVIAVVEDLMADEAYRLLNRDDRAFLAFNHPSSQKSFWDEQAADSPYYRLITRVGEGS